MGQLVHHFSEAVYLQRRRAMMVMLRDQNEPAAAIDIATACQWTDGSRESRRRLARELVARARLDGYRVCASNDGYWLARDAAEWKAYQDATRADAKFVFVRVAQAAEAVTDRANGQGRMFEDGPWAGVETSKSQHVETSK